SSFTTSKVTSMNTSVDSSVVQLVLRRRNFTRHVSSCVNCSPRKIPIAKDPTLPASSSLTGLKQRCELRDVFPLFRSNLLITYFKVPSHCSTKTDPSLQKRLSTLCKSRGINDCPPRY